MGYPGASSGMGLDGRSLLLVLTPASRDLVTGQARLRTWGSGRLGPPSTNPGLLRGSSGTRRTRRAMVGPVRRTDGWVHRAGITPSRGPAGMVFRGRASALATGRVLGDATGGVSVMAKPGKVVFTFLGELDIQACQDQRSLRNYPELRFASASYTETP